MISLNPEMQKKDVRKNHRQTNESNLKAFPEDNVLLRQGIFLVQACTNTVQDKCTHTESGPTAHQCLISS